MSVDATIRVRVGDFELDAALQAADGELVAVVGPNGAGKSTLLRALAGLAAIDGGRVCIDDVVVDDPGEGVFVPPERRSVGVVFQEYLLFPHLSVLDNVAFGRRARGDSRRASRAAARDALDRVLLGSRCDARPHELSGGEAQRVALARALAIEPALLLLDEPFAALDVQARAAMRHDIRYALAGYGGARILVTHDPVDALTLADRIVILERGRVVQVGLPDDVVARPRSQYVADLVGVNLYRGEARDHTIVLPGSDATLTVADAHAGPVLAVVVPHAVVLHRDAPAGTARNVWHCRIAGMERFGDRVRVRIDEPLRLVAEVTAGAVNALALDVGVDVWAAVKATEIAVYPE